MGGIVKNFIGSIRVVFVVSALLIFETTFGKEAPGVPPKEFRPVVLVTCASGELGSAAAKALAKDHDLILTGRNLEKLKSLQSELKKCNKGRAEIAFLDYTDGESLIHLKNALSLFSSPIEGVVLITPRPQFYGKDLLQDQKTWLEVFQETFTGPLEVLKLVLPDLNEKSKIVVIGGMSSVQLLPDSGPAAIIRRMWSTEVKALSYVLGHKGIRINTLSPGVILTEFHQERIAKKAEENKVSYEEQMERDVAHIPLHRHGNPEEIGQTIRFLLSDQSSFINGVNLVIDGGLTVCY